MRHVLFGFRIDKAAEPGQVGGTSWRQPSTPVAVAGFVLALLFAVAAVAAAPTAALRAYLVEDVDAVAAAVGEDDGNRDLAVVVEKDDGNSDQAVHAVAEDDGHYELAVVVVKDNGHGKIALLPFLSLTFLALEILRPGDEAALAPMST